jgi:hypothetical protein
MATRIYVTRKGAISARQGELGIIPGSMGARSFIVRGKGNRNRSVCSHGAGRSMSRSEAKRRFNRFDLAEQTAGIECRKDGGVIDEIPAAYKNIDAVMAHQSDLVEVVHTCARSSASRAERRNHENQSESPVQAAQSAGGGRQAARGAGAHQSEASPRAARRAGKHRLQQLLAGRLKARRLAAAARR